MPNDGFNFQDANTVRPVIAANTFGPAENADIWGNEKPDTSNAIDVTTIMPHKPFHVPVVNATDKVDVNGKVGNVEVTQRSTEVSKDVESTATAYMEADKLAKTTIQTAMEEVAAPEMAKAVGNYLAGPVTSTGAELIRPMIQTGVAGNIYEVFNAILNDRNAPNQGEIEEVLTKTLSQLHKQTEQQQEQYNASGQKPPQEFIDWKQIKSWEQLREFMVRDVSKDPVMQNVADARIGIAKMEENEQNAEELESRHADRRAGFEAQGVYISNNQVDEIPDPRSLHAIELAGNTLFEMPDFEVEAAPEVNENVLAMLAAAKMAQAKNDYEPDMNKLVPKTDSMMSA